VRALSSRDARTRDAKKKLDKIDTCAAGQIIDGGTGRAVPQIASPCDVCIDAGGTVDRKCLKSCFQLTIADFSDAILGDLPVCGDGILQPGEFCDDGNTVSGDCCSSTCNVEAGTTEGPMGNPTCSDALDNDCDGLVDATDPNCQ
jgi:cysteine-rich repeat protein